MSESKALSVRMVGFDRPGASFPENIGELPAFMLAQITEKYMYRPLTTMLLDAAKAEIYNMLSVANSIYGLGLSLDFWVVREHVDESSKHVEWIIRPVSITYMELHSEAHPEGGFTVSIPNYHNLAVRGPSEFEALIGLGRLVANRQKEL